MGSLYKLILKTNIKSPVIAMPLLFPVVLMLMYVPGVDSNAAATGIIFSLFAMMTMQSGLMGFGFNFMNLKKSVLLRRIGATQMKKWEVLGAVVLYGMTIWLISIVWVLALVALASVSNVFWSLPTDGGAKEYWHVKWELLQIGRILFATIISLFVSFSLGLFIVSISKNINMFQGIVMLYFFATMFIGGMIFNTDGTGGLPQWMEYAGYLIPHAYVNELFKWSSEAKGVPMTLTTWKFALDIIVPIVVGILAIAGSIKYLKFD